MRWFFRGIGLFFGLAFGYFVLLLSVPTAIAVMLSFL